MPVFSDLIGPAPDPAAPAGAERSQPPAGGDAAIPHPRGPLSDPHSSTPPPQASPPPDPAPTSGEPDPVEDFDPAGPPVGVIVGVVIVGAALLVLAALGMPFLLSKLRAPAEGPTYAVGDCVVQQGENAVIAECTAAGAYEIVSRVAVATDCPDPTLPTVSAGDDVFCLEPVGPSDSGGATADDGDGTGDDADLHATKRDVERMDQR